ncbi:MAG: hexokinase [Negativicutes bacterium]|jgi:hexokinase
MKVTEIVKSFTIPTETLKTISVNFAEEMRLGLHDHCGSLKMLPSFLDVPSGDEHGNYLAVDFGGSNVRVLLLKIADRKFEIVKRDVFSLRDGAKDFTAANVQAADLFDYIVAKIKATIDSETNYFLGHTFSFPCRQEGVKTSYLLNWTKEIKTAGVEGNDVGRLLVDALVRGNVSNVDNNVILNDTVGTLLAAAMADETVDIGSICGTGHNTCYREMNYPTTGEPMIVNMESGNFDRLEQNYFDKLLDSKSGSPGTQMLEKMVSGHYLGMLAGLVLSEHFAPHDIVISSADISAVVADGAAAMRTILDAQLPASAINDAMVADAAEIVVAIAVRSARLVGATFAAVIQHSDPTISRKHTIAIDGSLYEKMPDYPGNILQAVLEIMPDAANKVRTILSKDGSGVGAAMAAAAAAGIAGI